ncbi:hypothetical protein CONPUDRAFT_148166 [Coniophora puteana RWD-64-598 SS2]|uniref:Uncharacterized protein n=1 Tax=Coniophora puteana (strain RWD-64-598) TaxID=741705 RepID=A0A5M3N5B6_CONPW|nr:uncharacterized protein CONPUDRAFT_148166 [Coniophora puteana RWD-64-598 SS2]EIW86045.1 hypothetical protein CONPUDRAFT_148166 [Coniophora puteana RWD-64-598 SS2]
MEKQTMQVREVLSEREAEITGPEPLTPEAQAKAQAQEDIVSHLLPAMISRFKAVRIMQLHAIGPGEVLDGQHMAQKESRYKEQVDKLELELAQVQRSHDAPTTLSRDQTINSFTAVEDLHAKHEDTARKLEQVQAKETELKNIEKTKAEHAAAVEALKGQDAGALKVKGEEVDALMTTLKEENESNATSFRSELSEASATLEKPHQEREEACGKLQKEYEEALSSADGRTPRSQAFKFRIEVEALKAKDEQISTDMSRPEEYYNELTELRTSHGEATQKRAFMEDMNLKKELAILQEESEDKAENEEAANLRR